MTDKWEKVELGGSWDFRTNKEIEGELVGMEENVGPNESTLYHIKKANGEILGVWGSTVIDSRMRTFEPGDKVRIIYQGMAKSPTTGREYHNFDIFKKRVK